MSSKLQRGVVDGPSAVLPVENGTLFALMYVIENGLRELIIDRMAGSFGPHWMKNGLPGDVLTRVREAKEYERRTPWSSFVPLHPLYYLAFPDLATIVEKKDNWEKIFQPVFQRKDVAIALLRKLEPLRNKVAHNRRATADDVMVANAALVQLERTLCQSTIGMSLESFALRCTTAPDLREQFTRLHRELLSAAKAMLEAKPLSELTISREIKDQWWYDKDYLLRDLTALDRDLELIADYSSLPHGRGRGHVIEAWVRSNAMDFPSQACITLLKSLGTTELAND